MPTKPAKCSRPDCDDPSADSRGCSPAMQPFCRRHRTAAMGMRSVYKLTDEEAAQRCIDNGSANPPPKVSAAKRATTVKAAPKKPAATVVKRPASPESSPVAPPVDATASDFAAKVRSELDALGTEAGLRQYGPTRLRTGIRWARANRPHAALADARHELEPPHG